MLRLSYLGFTLRKERIFVTDDITIGNGRKALIIGDNASGKSLLLKAINGDFGGYEGDIFIKEKPPLFYRKRKSSILLEYLVHILPDSSVRKNISLPLEKVTKRIQQKIEELSTIAEIDKFLNEKAGKLSYSQQNFIELIRVVIQLPYVILIDDLDNFFDEKNLDKAYQIINYAVHNGSTVVATSKKRLENFDDYFRIQNKKVVEL